MHISNIDHLSLVPGVVALTVTDPKKTTAGRNGRPELGTFRGVESWEQTLDDALGLLAHTDEPAIGVTVGAHTIVARREGAALVAVVIPTGHKVTKSIHRLIRQHAVRAPREAKGETVTEQGDEEALDALEQHMDAASL